MTAAPDVVTGRHVLLVVSGGIAAYKAASLARALLRGGATVQALLTPAAATFIGPATFEGLTGRTVPTDVFSDSDHVPHIHLARQADVAVFAPATANLIAKLAVGIADDLVTSTALMLDCPVVIAPAMHTEMWRHDVTQANIATLRHRGAHIVGPDDGPLAAGDTGEGRLADEDAIVAAVAAAIAPSTSPLTGRRVIVSAGGTREPIDPVRYIGNRSSGKMGYALARQAARRGADVDLVTAPTHLDDPVGVRLHRVETAEQMRTTIMDLVADAEVVIKAAAVADFRPARYSGQKIKKDSDELTRIELVRNRDILAELGENKDGRLLVGFAAETDLAEDHARDKLHRKGLDLIVVNRVDMADAGFNVDTNRAVLLRAEGGRREVPLTTKDQLAAVVCDEVEELLAQR
ncbi:MAG: bifunctional phosphopantothenoylcysteine decarboxylase/phosphopantothenate--cysteine ligase CoaBC [Actinobacteria bacterium]|nr:bifunctional phosphopantothenoylcysteine decarboxylase/phosphopantothenate--cysteine ligase CoaBC [Actinomycetota bacterium]